jgi:HK97 family phage portal protein
MESYLFNDMPIVTFQNLNSDLLAGYMQNEVVYSIVNKVANTASSVPLKLYDTEGNEVDSHWTGNLLSLPNEDTTFQELYRDMLIYYLSVGNGYLYAPKLRGGNAREMWLLPATYVLAVSGGVYNPIKGYKMYVGSQEVILPKDDVLHLKMFNPQFTDGNFAYGLSPIKVAADIISNLNNGNKRLEKMLESGMPPFIISAKSQDGLSPKQQEDLEAAYKRKYGTAGDPNKPLLSGVELKVDKLGFSAADLSIIENSIYAQRVLCNIYGVPSVLMNDLKESSYNNINTEYERFYGDTIKPLNNLFAHKLTQFLVPETGLQFKFDYSEVPVLSNQRAELMKQYAAVPFLTEDEKREIFGFEPLKRDNNETNLEESM